MESRALMILVASLSILASCNDSDGSNGLGACASGAACDSPDAICVADDLRCQCMPTETGSPRVFCEPAICPEPAIAGEACTMPGLECDFDGYDHTLCLGPDPVWVRCQSARLGNHCPAAPPSQGAPCCVVPAGDSDSSCGFQDGSVWACVSNRWTPQR